MFGSILVPIDFTEASDRAIPVAVTLARRGRIPLELVTVIGSNGDEASAARLLDDRCDALYATRVRRTVVRSDDLAWGVVHLLDERRAPLLVMASHARGIASEQLLGSVSRTILATTRHPTVVVGPSVELRPPPPMTTLVIGVDGSEAAEAILPVGAAFVQTFGGEAPRVVQVVPRGNATRTHGPAPEASAYVDRAINELDRFGVHAHFAIAHGLRPSNALLQTADSLAGAMIAVASERWAAPATARLVSTARAVTRHSHSPVLIAPTQRVRQALTAVA